MKIWVFTICHNEAQMAPWFLRHYGSFADRILVWDDQSTDGTREILKAHPSVTLFDCPWQGLNEDKALHLAYDVYPSARGKTDWCIWVDMDEFVHSLVLMNTLRYGAMFGVLRPKGYNMVSEGLPINGYEHKQIYDHIKTGVEAPLYSKPVIFKPEETVRWVRGKHFCEPDAARGEMFPELRLLHYRYLGAEFTRLKNAKNYERLGNDKGVGWTCDPTYKGEGSPEWAGTLKNLAFHVL